MNAERCDPPRCLRLIGHDGRCTARCEYQMPLARDVCLRLRGHHGAHRSAYAMQNQREWKMLGRPW